MMMSFLSNTSTGKKQKEQQDAEELHRKRVAQILRYISTMQITGSNLACQQFSFVRTLDDPRQRYGPFFQDMKSTAYEDDIGGGRILFSLFDFQRLASLLADERAQLPFTFYTARSNAANQRNFLGNHHTTSSDSCWLRLTRLTGADVPSPPPLSPPIIDFLQSWLGNDRSMRLITLSPTGSSVLQQLETLLSWDQLRQPIPPTATPKVQRWWRRYTYYRKLLQLQRQLEPLYNHLFEWYHQTQESSSMGSSDSLDLIWGLGQAQKRVRDTVIDGPLLEVRVEVELARDGALLVRPKEHAGVALNRYVLGAISSSTNNATEDVEAKSGGESLTIRQLRQLVEGMNASDLSPGEPSTYVSLLKRMAVELSSGGTFQSSTNIKKSKRLESLLQQGQLVVTDAWCLYSSPRPTAVWARDAWTFAEKLSMNSSQMTIPQALKALTLGPGALDETNDSNEDTPNPSSLAKALAWFQMTKKAQLESRTMKSRPPFPLPTSDAQNRIADLLMTRKYPAVVCEGPPGTGKVNLEWDCVLCS